MKTCKHCKETKEVSKENFYVSKVTNSGFEGTCKICRYATKKKQTQARGPEYMSWIEMKRRCDNPNAHEYKHYGLRGIDVCQRWRDSYDDFLADMGRIPSSKHSIDRINNDGNYEPSNCRWATPSEQLRNRRLHSSNKSGVHGVRLNPKGDRWMAVITTNRKVTYLGTFDDVDDAIKARKQAEHKYWHDDISIL